MVARTGLLYAGRAPLGRQLDGRVEDGSNRFLGLAHDVGPLIDIRNPRRKSLRLTNYFRRARLTFSGARTLVRSNGLIPASASRVRSLLRTKVRAPERWKS